MSCQPSHVSKVYQWLINQQPCLLCDGPSRRALALCEDCEADMPWLSGQCRQCALPMPSHQALCADCSDNPPFFSKVVTPLQFDFPVDTLISRFKYQQSWP